MKNLILTLLPALFSAQAFIGLNSNAFRFASEAGEPIIGKDWEVFASGGYNITGSLYAVGSIGYRNLEDKFSYSIGARYNFDGLGFMQADTNGDYVRISVGPIIMDRTSRFSIEPTGMWWQQVTTKRRVKERLTFGVNFNYWIK
ncbi:hypothetical protein SAMN05443429_11220 [Cruoricaptor ignavus]|uniref:Outer membrane protein beta-barrel domain-containing protein n=1 Tax=Cruoricaptor ignavus TaxID=1118202 RepID=A0A1M6HD67_9FLAO|nr:hypothetical protein [Cruoricaptor ignavus]SHJ20110.1 hypothetical protein SAMN05443429_11220 [Cruoricaptor ignavus]